ncbi:hypothetical protein TH63_15215 [Rufibacter radiotolerans]|uniref:Uncharacterized protein n=1 Tax=Rufibacter radiotolerans TaxID=1379910 RepID=A0A0H4VRV0_9BACT|nr:hypothetical protein TH63_15215 [Rufibacter radiotolerans]
MFRRVTNEQAPNNWNHGQVKPCPYLSPARRAIQALQPYKQHTGYLPRTWRRAATRSPKHGQGQAAAEQTAMA